MRKHRIFFLLAICLTLFFATCKKDDTPSFTEADLTVANGWSIIDAEANLDVIAPSIAASIPEEDLGFFTRAMITALFISADAELETIEVCESDDVYIFLAGGTINFSNGGTVCDPSGSAQSDAIVPSNTTWSLEGRRLTLVTSGETHVFTIKDLTDTRLVIEISEKFDDNTTGFSTDDDLVIRYTFRAN